MFTNTAPTQHKVLHSVTHSAFNVLNIMAGIRYIMEWWPHIIRIIHTFLKLHLPECIQPKQTWLHTPPHTHTHTHTHTPAIHRTSLNHSQVFSAAARKLLHIFSWLQTPTSFNCPWFLPEGSNLFVTSCLQPDINAHCRQ